MNERPMVGKVSNEKYQLCINIIIEEIELTMEDWRNADEG